MAEANCTTNSRLSDADFLHASEHAHTDAKTNGGGEVRDLLSVIEETFEEERTRPMLANSILGCLQIALDPEAISVAPPVYFPEVLEQARQLINTSVRRLEYEDALRLLYRWMGSTN